MRSDARHSNPGAPPGPGEALPLVRRLTGAPDPLALFTALTGKANQPDTLLLESADAATGVGEHSILVVRSMLRLECRCGRVTATPLTGNGVELAHLVAKARPDSALGPGMTSAPPHPREAGTVTSAVSSPAVDERGRLLAPSPFDALRAAVFAPRIVSPTGPFAHFAAGVFGYDCIDLLERLPAPRRDDDDFADFVFWVPDRSLVIDHVRRTTTLTALVVGGADSAARYHDAMQDIGHLARAVEAAMPTSAAGAPKAATSSPPATTAAPHEASVTTDLSDTQFAEMVRTLQRHVVAGNVFQIVPSRTFSVACEDPLAAYARLRAANPSPYQFFVRAPDFTLFGTSPETAVRVAGTPKRITIRPLAGTVPRGRQASGAPDVELDARLQAQLLTDTKEIAEHLMLVDLARNDVARVSRPGSRRVARLLEVERYQHVMHLVSEVTGELDDGLDALHAYLASANMGTLVGAPKIRAAALLREHELTRRGPYGGAVGYLDHDGCLDTAIVIRSAFVRDGVAQVRTGAGVVLDSDPDAEAQETRHKAASVLAALTTEHP